MNRKGKSSKRSSEERKIIEDRDLERNIITEIANEFYKKKKPQNNKNH